MACRSAVVDAVRTANTDVGGRLLEFVKPEDGPRPGYAKPSRPEEIVAASETGTRSASKTSA
jgi:hypothetical protein